jgi:Tfp pilus assembly protein PilF
MPLLLAATTGCASSGAAGRPSGLDGAIARAGLERASIIVPYEINDEMRAWVQASVPVAAEPKVKVEALLNRLLADDHLHLEYSGTHTGTAQEVWNTHTANCVGFTHLFVGLARAAGLRVTFLRVDDITTYNRDGDLVVVAGHMTVGYGDGLDMRILDFSPFPVRKYRQITAVADHTAVALFYSNRGAEELRAGRNDSAIENLQIATRIDPSLADGWVNLGVALRRTQGLDAAEKAYRRALQVDPESPSAYQNLAVLMRMRGNGDAADGLLRLAGSLEARNPYTYLALGDWSLANRRYADAQKFYKTALRVSRGGTNADPAAAMGQWAIAAGEPGRAQEWLDKAKRIDPANDRVMRLEQALALRPDQRSAL